MVYTKRGTSGVKYFSLFHIMAAFWILMYIMESLAPTLEMKVFFNYLKYIGIVATPTLFLFFSIKYSRSKIYKKRIVMASLWVIPILILLLNWTDQLHGLLRKNERITEIGSLNLYRYDATLLQDLLDGYLLLIAFAGVIILAFFGSRTRRSNPTAILFITAAAMMPILGETISLMIPGNMHYFDIPPFFFIFTAVFILMGILKFDLFHISSLPREDIIDRMREAVISIDNEGRIVDINDPARKIFHLENENIFETLISDTIPQVAAIIERMNSENNDIGSIEVNEEEADPRFYEVRISHHNEKIRISNGKVIIIEDVTEKRAMLDRINRERKSYLSTLDNIDDWVWEMKVDGTFTYSNNAIEKIMGYSPEEVIGTKSTLFWRKEDLVPLKIKDAQNYLSKGKPWKGQYFRYQHKDGRTVLVQSTGNPIFDHKGKFIGYRGVDRDVTSKDQWALRLRENANNFINVLQMLHVGVLIIRKNTDRVFFANKSLEELFGIPEDKLVGSRMKDLVAEYGIKIIDAKNGEREDLDYTSILINRDGKMIPMEIKRTEMILDEENKEIMTFINLEDKIRAKEAQEKLNDFLKQVNKILRHDISNDLMIVDNSASMYQNTGDEKYLTQIHRSVERSYDLISKMRELEASFSMDTLLQRYDARSILEDISKNFDIELNITGDGSIIADNAIYSVLRNIITNAIKHGLASSIDINIRTEGDHCSISMADNGKGIPADVKDKIFFEGFSHGENGGTGIGLFVVSNIMERYGGSVTVMDNDPEGTKFILVFPSM
jgi:PAS domain S-box-containing protein